MASQINYITSSEPSVPSPFANYAETVLLNELNRLEKLRQSVNDHSTFLKEATTQNSTQLENKTGQIEKINQEIASLSQNLAQLEAQLQQFTEQKSISHCALANPIDTSCSSTEMDKFVSLTSLIENLSKEKSECKKKLDLAQNRKTRNEKSCNDFKQKISTLENQTSKDVEVINEISLKILSIQNFMPNYAPTLNNTTTSSSIDSIEQKENLVDSHLKRKKTPNSNKNSVSIDLANEEKSSNPSHQTENMGFAPTKLTPLQQRLIAFTANGKMKTDPELCKLLQEEKFECTPRQIKIERQILQIQSSNGRKTKYPISTVRNLIGKIISEENPKQPFSDEEIREKLKGMDYDLLRAQVRLHRKGLGHGSSSERFNKYKNNQNSNSTNDTTDQEVNNSNSNSHSLTTISESETIQIEQLFSSKSATMKAYVKRFIKNESPSKPLSDKNISGLLQKVGLPSSIHQVGRRRRALGILGPKKRHKSDNSNTNDNSNASTTSSMVLSKD